MRAPPREKKIIASCPPVMHATALYSASHPTKIGRIKGALYFFLAGSPAKKNAPAEPVAGRRLSSFGGHVSTVTVGDGS